MDFVDRQQQCAQPAADPRALSSLPRNREEILMGLSVRCPKCEADVPVPAEWQTPTIPPMVPNIPLPILLREIGHQCELADIVKVLNG